MTTDTAGGPDRLLYLLQVANASFPTGAFNHSYGFETWIDADALDDAASFGSACRDWLRYAAIPTDGAVVAHAYRHAATGEHDALLERDAIVGALKLSRELREASYKTGRALLAAYRDIFSAGTLASLAVRWERGAARDTRPSSSARGRRRKGFLRATRSSPSCTPGFPTSSASARG